MTKSVRKSDNAGEEFYRVIAERVKAEPDKETVRKLAVVLFRENDIALSFDQLRAVINAYRKDVLHGE